MYGYLRVEQPTQRPGAMAETGTQTDIPRAQRRGILLTLRGRKPQTESPTQLLIHAKCKLVTELWTCDSPLSLEPGISKFLIIFASWLHL